MDACDGIYWDPGHRRIQTFRHISLIKVFLIDQYRQSSDLEIGIGAWGGIGVMTGLDSAILLRAVEKIDSGCGPVD